MEKKGQAHIVEGDDEHWNKVVKHKLAEDHLVVVLMNGWKAETEVCQARVQTFLGGKHSQRQADEKTQGPDQNKHEDYQVHGGRLVGVGDDHGSSHGHSTQGVGTGCQAEREQELIDLTGDFTERPSVAHRRVESEGDEDQGQEVGQSHAEEEDVQAVLT